jgi:RNA polymerase sigma factor (sigma-70 family)
MDYSKFSDAELIEDIQNNASSDSLKELTSRYSPVCYKLYERFSSRLGQKGYYSKDFDSDKDYLIWKAASSYEKGKSKFITWLWVGVVFHFKSVLRKRRHLVSIDSDELISKAESISYNPDMEDGTEEYVLSILDKLNDKRVKTIYQMRYFNKENREAPWREIAKELDLSIQGAINIHKSAKKYLKHALTREENITNI